MYWFSSSLLRLLKSTRPQGSLVLGSRAAIFTAAGENRAGSIWLLTKGNALLRPDVLPATVIPRPAPRHSSPAIRRKSPASTSAVGTNWKAVEGVERLKVR